MTHSDRRVVITGMGLISPLGNSCEALWDCLSNSRSGVARIERLPTDDLPSDVGGEAREFTGDVEDFGPLEKLTKRNIKKGLKLMCREIQMGVAASQLALTGAGLTPEIYDPDRIGTMFGSDYIITEPVEFARGIQNCIGGDGQGFIFQDWAEKGMTQVEPLWLLKYLPNMPASHVAIYNDLRGPSNSITVREASANLAVAEATTTIRRGVADVMIAGATGSRIQSLRTIHVSLQEQLADRYAPPADGDPEKASRPFDKHRTGMVLGEGAGVLVLEDMEFAQKRGAKILGEVVGYCSSSVADKNGVADYRAAFSNVINGALRKAGMSASEIGHVHAHAMGVNRCDQEEAIAISELLGDPVVCAVKSYMGNLGAGSGIVEIISSVLAINRQQMFETLNCENPDPKCPVKVSTRTDSPGHSFLNLNITPQGQASAVIIGGV
jgi:3-oxoacyl-[acyl-carrier-protein] synthase II